MSDTIKRIPIQDLETFEGRAKHLYKIQDKNGINDTFKFLQTQKILNDIIEEEYVRTQRELGYSQARIIILKPRQFGGTTYAEIRSLDQQIYDEGSNGVITAHDQDTTEKIYQIYKRAFNNLPDYVIPTLNGKDMTVRMYRTYMIEKAGKSIDKFDMSSSEYSEIQKIKIKPELETYSGKRIGFKDTDSITSIFTAGKGDTGGLGGTIRRVIFCIHEDSKIILSSGEAKPIKDVQIGETVVCSDGTISPIVNKFDGGVKPTILLETWMADEGIKVSKDHKVLTSTGWKKAGKLNVGDWIQVPKIELTNEIKEYTYDLNERENFNHTTTTGVKRHTFKLDNDFGYLIGYYLAEGHIKKQRKKELIQVEFAHHTDETYVNRIVERFSGLCNRVTSERRENSKTHKTTLHGVFLASVLNDICGRTENKHIPDWIFKTNKNFVEGIVVGYLAGDGSKNGVVQKRSPDTNPWTPENSPEKIYNYLKDYEKCIKLPRIIDIDSKYGISETAGCSYKLKYGGMSLNEIKENWMCDFLTHMTPEKMFNYLTERDKCVRYPTKEIHKKYEITNTTGHDWRKKYTGYTVEQIRDVYGGSLKETTGINYFSSIHATSICEKISRQIRRLITCLDLGVPGIKFYNNRYRYDVKTKDIYTVLINGRPAKELSKKIEGCFTQESERFNDNLTKYRKINGKWFVKLKNIEESDTAQTYDIEVAHHTHDFETPIGIVSNSESASYDKYKQLLTAVNPSVPKFADGVFYMIESTANGTTGDGEGYYKEWTRAVKGWDNYIQGKTQSYNGLRPVFIPWYMIDEYELPVAGGKYEAIDEVDFGSPEAKREFLQREEEYLTKGIYNPLTQQTQILTPEKINWYRMTIKVDCLYDYQAAQRFYPTTIEEAFVASSNTFFDSYKLSERKTKLINDPEPYEVGEIEYNENNGDLEFAEHATGNLRIFEKPIEGWRYRYVTGVDIATGREDGDWSVAYVKDRITQRIVATYYGRIDQDLFARKLSELGLYYNESLMVVERNLSMVIELLSPDGLMPYIGELYYTESGHHIQWGYWTGGGESGTRNILINKHKAFLRDNPISYDYLPDVETVDEHISFVRKTTKTGVKYEADEGKHDDRVISLALCNIGDDWWETAPEQYTSKRIIEVITRPNRKRQKYIRQHQLGKNKK